MANLKPLMKSEKQDWQTPSYIFDPINEAYDFDIDSAASPDNNLLPEFWTEKDDALKQSWEDKKIWCNPPYSKAKLFIAKALAERGNAEIIALLLPFRPDTVAFQSLNNCYVYAIKGRIKFVGGENSAPFPSCLIFLGTKFKPKNLKIPGKWILYP